ncbi:MAG: TIM barrel protein [Spirochaetia bacterium]|jgi:sugar phosphate isomerase/epimerase
MKVHVGVKSDPIESRYSYEWLFDLMRGLGLSRIQMGTTYNTFHAEDEYFRRLRKSAEKRQVRISSIFSARRELVGFGSGDPLLEKASFQGWKRLIEVGALLGADTVGSNGFFLLRDRPELRQTGVDTFLKNIKLLLPLARKAGLKALTVEPMSSIYEYPSTPGELGTLFDALAPFLAEHPKTTVPLLLCSDISHGVADAERKVVYDNWSLFEQQIPWMWEFHFKNTDAAFDATFGFAPADRARGIVDLPRLKALIDGNAARFPVKEITGYLEINGPKTGRDYHDGRLEGALVQSLEALKAVFDGKEESR